MVTERAVETPGETAAEELTDGLPTPIGEALARSHQNAAERKCWPTSSSRTYGEDPPPARTWAGQNNARSRALGRSLCARTPSMPTLPPGVRSSWCLPLRKPVARTHQLR